MEERNNMVQCESVYNVYTCTCTCTCTVYMYVFFKTMLCLQTVSVCGNKAGWGEGGREGEREGGVCRFNSTEL